MRGAGLDWVSMYERQRTCPSYNLLRNGVRDVGCAWHMMYCHLEPLKIGGLTSAKTGIGGSSPCLQFQCPSFILGGGGGGGGGGGNDCNHSRNG